LGGAAAVAALRRIAPFRPGLVARRGGGPMTSGEKTNILLVNDDVTQLLALETFLEELGQNVVKAKSGREALLALLTQDFAVILLDVRMPEMDGFETAALIRQRQTSARTPIIFVTAVDQSEAHSQRGYALGAVDYIHAPVSPKILRTKVAVYVELARREQALRASEHRFQATFEQAAVGIAHMSSDGRWLRVNPKLCEILGHTREELMQKSCVDLVHPEEHEAIAANMRRLQASEIENCSLEVRCRRPAGSEAWVGLTLSIVQEYEGGSRYFLAVIEDVTRRKHAEEELQRSLDELARSNAELEQFAYAVSHDLQEPLRMVAGYVQLLAERYGDKLDNSAREFIAFAVDGVTRMKQMITDLLAYSRAGRNGSDTAQVSCETALGRACAYLQAAIKETGAEITHDPLPRLQGNSSQLVSLFQNLIGNAVKFRGQAPPRIHVSAALNKKEWVFSVRDNGIGMDPQHADRIFMVFQRLHRREDYPGTGIGLAIARKIVERRGGRIWVESAPGKGSTFFFTFPARASEARA
jgi:PAS domain S-box-containing protein